VGLGAYRHDQSVFGPELAGLLRAPAAALKVAGERLGVGRRQATQEQLQQRLRVGTGDVFGHGPSLALSLKKGMRAAERILPAVAF
jgi:hypothetical protein